ncbi:hypothetical protein M513_13803 [Trichuris suis]|uniref:Uncharacterized protein n=1 Tax=Trichuris suis TaxID=68888 RepID=A0A085LK24_9BILA|nr:hypothetical protein M513_13803 [Trichuris suis]
MYACSMRGMIAHLHVTHIEWDNINVTFIFTISTN